MFGYNIQKPQDIRQSPGKDSKCNNNCHKLYDSYITRYLMKI